MLRLVSCVGVSLNPHDRRAGILVVPRAGNAEESRGVELVTLDERLEAAVKTLQLSRRHLSGQQEVHVVLGPVVRSEEHTSELQSLMRISYAVFCLKKKNTNLINKYSNLYTKNL